MIKKITVYTCQILVVIVARLIFTGRVRVFLKTEMPNRNVIVVSNHPHGTDPFVITPFLPIKTLIKTMPFAFMIKNGLYYRWWKPLAWIIGGYPSSKRKEDQPDETYGIGASRKLLNEGYSVLVFPEGKVTPHKAPARSGVKYIKENLEIDFLLVKIVKKKLFRKIHYYTYTDDHPLEPNEIVDKIYSLSQD